MNKVQLFVNVSCYWHWMEWTNTMDLNKYKNEAMTTKNEAGTTYLLSLPHFCGGTPVGNRTQTNGTGIRHSIHWTTGACFTLSLCVLSCIYVFYLVFILFNEWSCSMSIHWIIEWNYLQRLLKRAVKCVRNLKSATKIGLFREINGLCVELFIVSWENSLSVCVLL